MQGPEPSEFQAERSPLGERPPRAVKPPGPSEEQLAALDEILEDGDDGSDAFFESLIMRHSGDMALTCPRILVQAL